MVINPIFLGKAYRQCNSSGFWFDDQAMGPYTNYSNCPDTWAGEVRNIFSSFGLFNPTGRT